MKNIKNKKVKQTANKFIQTLRKYLNFTIEDDWYDDENLIAFSHTVIIGPYSVYIAQALKAEYGLGVTVRKKKEEDKHLLLGAECHLRLPSYPETDMNTKCQYISTVIKQLIKIIQIKSK